MAKQIRGTGALLGASVLSAPAIVHMSAYANSLDPLIPDLYAALDEVSRELVGFIPSVNRDTGVERARVGQSVVYGIAPEMQAYDIAPAMNTPEPPDHTTGSGSMAITKSRAAAFGFTGEEQRGLNTGPGYLSTQAQWIAQGLRTLTNEVESDLATEARTHASRAYGTAGTAPFESDLKSSAFLRKILDDNGASPERSLILNTTAGANMRSLPNLTRVNEAGEAMTLRQGELLDLHNFSIKESAKLEDHAGGTADSAQTDGSAYAVGATQITLAAAGTGNIVVGDVISFAGDNEKYVVTGADTDVSDGGTITISAPGLRRPIPAEATAVTVAGDYGSNVGFSRSALHLAMRAPALPQEGDAAVDRQMIIDPRSGIAFEISIYAGYRKMRGEIAAAWGVHASKREHIALLLG